MSIVCAVCGHSPEGDVVHCTSCEGVYHRDCWMFFGACARYACGGVAFEEGFPAVAAVEVVIDASAPEPPPRVAPSRPGEEAYVQLGLVTSRVEYGQVLTLLNRERIRYRVHQPQLGERFMAWIYVPYSSYYAACRRVADEQLDVDVTPLLRRQDLVNYPWLLAACVAAWVATPAHVATIAVVGIFAVCGRDVKDRAVSAWRRLTSRRKPLLPSGKDAP